MRVAVRIVAVGEQRSRRAQRARDDVVLRAEPPIDVIDVHAADHRPVGTVGAIRLHDEQRLDSVRLTQLEIFLAVVGRLVDQSGPLIGGDEISRHHRTRLVEERVRARERVRADGAGEVGASKAQIYFAAPSIVFQSVIRTSWETFI